MAKVTSKLQVTVPKAIAAIYRIRPGDEIEWTPAGDVIRVERKGNRPKPDDMNTRLELFDRATERQRERESGWVRSKDTADRGWKREDLYDRGGAR